jgi:hypothetical protein
LNTVSAKEVSKSPLEIHVFPFDTVSYSLVYQVQYLFNLSKMFSLILLFNLFTQIQNKYTDCKGVKNNTNFGQITGIQEKLDTTCK